MHGNAMKRVLGALLLVSAACADASAPSTPGTRAATGYGGPPSPGDAAAPKPTFTVYDGTLFGGKPDNLTARHFPPFKIVYAAALWPTGASRVEPNEAQIRNVAKSIGASETTDHLVMLDIEHWPTCAAASDAERSDNLRKLGLAAAWFSSERPDLSVGFYSLPPCRDYWNAISSDANKRKAWLDLDDKHVALADSVRAFYPSLYTFYDDRAGWVAYAKANIQEARRLAAGKRVYPILWIDYHDSNATLKGTRIPADFWKLELETVGAEADGIVIWGGYTQTWRESDPWWSVTEQYAKARAEAP